jgi:hypothetical protein
MCGQLCVPDGAGVGDVVDVDDDDGDELDDVVCAIVVAAGAAPPVDASATPVAPAPTPAATTPVMRSRRARPPILAIMWFSLLGGHGRLAVQGHQAAKPDWPCAQAVLSAHSELLPGREMRSPWDAGGA